MATKVTIAGTGSVTVDVEEGKSVKDVLVAVAQELGLENPVPAVERLAPVVDAKPAKLEDRVTPETARITAAPAVRNG